MHSSPSTSFNPARFTDIIKEDDYRVWTSGVALRKERAELVDWLRKKYKDNQACQSLAHKLQACKRGARCKSPACPECSTAAQDLVTQVTRKFLKEKAKTATIVCVSIVPADGITNPGQLSPAQHHRNVRRWKEALGRAGVTWFIGGSDWSFNEHKDDRYPRHISHHFYGFAAADDLQILKRDLQERFPKTDAIPRPAKVQEWDGKKRPIAYMMKLEFNRRIASDEGERFNKTNGKNRSCRATDKQPLKSSQRRKLLLHLDQIGLQGRLMLRWLQILHLGAAGSAVVERGPNGRVRGNG
jgi:hypothetical protein